MFLDPFGMSVEWTTLTKIAATKKVDMIYLFPTHGVSRQTPHDGERMSTAQEAALIKVLGGDWWKEEFYEERAPAKYVQASLFGDLEEHKEGRQRRVTSSGIELAFHKRLSSLFPYVAPTAVPLTVRGVHMFSLFFAVANPDRRAWGLASKAATAIFRAG